MIVIIFKIFASTILAEERKHFLVTGSARRSKRVRASSSGTDRDLLRQRCNAPNCGGDVAIDRNHLGADQSSVNEHEIVCRRSAARDVSRVATDNGVASAAGAEALRGNHNAPARGATHPSRPSGAEPCRRAITTYWSAIGCANNVRGRVAARCAAPQGEINVTGQRLMPVLIDSCVWYATREEEHRHTCACVASSCPDVATSAT